LRVQSDCRFEVNRHYQDLQRQHQRRYDEGVPHIVADFEDPKDARHAAQGRGHRKH
jgi:hypothetical protein